MCERFLETGGRGASGSEGWFNSIPGIVKHGGAASTYLELTQPIRDPAVEMAKTFPPQQPITTDE